MFEKESLVKADPSSGMLVCITLKTLVLAVMQQFATWWLLEVRLIQLHIYLVAFLTILPSSNHTAQSWRLRAMIVRSPS